MNSDFLSYDATEKDIILTLPDFAGGGAERAAINLARAMRASGARPRFLVERNAGALAQEASETAPVDYLGGADIRTRILMLRNKMKKKRAAVFISFMTRSNILCALARLMLASPPVLIVTEHNNRSRLLNQTRFPRRLLSFAALAIAFHSADRVVCVSDGIVKITRELFAVSPRKLVRIYNPIVCEETTCRNRLDAAPKTAGQEPLIVAAGRLHPQKDFTTLIHAAAKLRRTMAFRLLIFGEGPEREKLKTLIRRENLEGVVSLPGFSKNLAVILARADLFVLSSAWEGFGNVIAEALACGTPVVSTDCESGPREILADGRYGRLTPVGDADALAAAMRDSLLTPTAVPADAARRFWTMTAARRYLALIDDITAHRG